LRINNKWVSRAVIDNSGVLKRHSISRKTFSLPYGLVSRAGEYGKRVNSFSERNLLLNDVS